LLGLPNRNQLVSQVLTVLRRQRLLPLAAVAGFFICTSWPNAACTRTRIISMH